MSARRADLLAIAFFFILAVLAVGPGLLPGRTPLPLDILGLFEPWRGEWPSAVNPEVGDAVLQFSSRVFMAQALKAGHYPLWDPTIMAGHPLAGDTHSSPFYPPLVLLSLLLPPLGALAAQVLLQTWLAGVWMYVWLRQLRPGRFAAAVAGVSYLLAGYLQVWRLLAPFPGTLCWLPAIPAAWEHAQRTGSRVAVALGALALALAITAGQVQFVAYGLLVLGVYGLGRLAMLPPAERRRGAAAGAAILGLGLVLAGVHILPAYELALETVRRPFTVDALVQTGVPLRQLVTALAPWFLGDPRRGDYRGAQNATEMMLYIGVLPMALVILAVYVRRDRLALLFSLLALLVAAFALATPVAWLQAGTPWLQRFGLMRWLGIWPLVTAPLVALVLAAAQEDAVSSRRLRQAMVGVSLALAAALILAAWRDPLGRPTVLLALGWLAGSALVVVVWSLRPGELWRRALVLAVVTADLATFARGYTPSAPARSFFPPLPPLDRLVAERRHEPFRVVEFQGDTIALGPSVAPSLGLDEIGGYTSSGRESYRRFLAALSAPPGNDFLRSNPNMVALGGADPRLLRLLNVRYVLSATGLPPFERSLDPASACRHTRVLQPGEAVGTTVIPWVDGLNRIDVAVASGGPVAVHLVDERDPTRHLAYAELAPGDSVVRTMYFEPVRHSAGRPFRAYTDLPAASAGSPPEMCLEDDALAVGLGATQAPYPLAFQANGLRVYQAPAPFGRAWVVSDVQFASSQSDALHRLVESAVDPALTVIVDGYQAVSERRAHLAGSVATVGGPAAVRADVVDEGPNVRRVRLSQPARGWLVLSEAWAPGWRATVDGRPAPVLRAYGGLQAVPLEAEAHQVLLRYRPTSVSFGAVLTLLGLAVVGGLLIRPHQLVTAGIFK